MRDGSGALTKEDKCEVVLVMVCMHACMRACIYVYTYIRTPIEHGEEVLRPSYVTSRESHDGFGPEVTG